MQDFIDFICSTLLDWPLGTLLGSVLVLSTLLGAGLLLAGIYYLVDSVGGIVESGSAHVVCKTFTPAHMRTIWVYNATTKTTMPTYVFHSDCWTVVVDVGVGRGRFDVPREFFESVTDGYPVSARFKRGRFSGKVYVKGLSAGG
uniref:Transmembrane protein n=1 Tax=Burkholderia sp. M701 TaxID=326454 RepID=V5YNN5_9BURK|nr:hypothetical protein [Burkholderia sp. M701]BAO18997.1 hypothetical protein [Burkholderia sp. M701]